MRLVLLSVLVLPLPWTAHAFAEWTKCWTELEEGEIIMNQRVRRQVVSGGGGSGDDECSSSGGGVMVRLIAMDTNGRPVQPRRIRREDVPAKEISPNDHVANDEEVESKGFDGYEEVMPFISGQTFHLKLEYASPSNDDACSTDPNDIAPTLPANTQYLAQSTDGGKFLGRAAMCDGARAVGKKRDDIIRIQLTGGDGEEDEETGVVRLWAGYASEKAAVVLTPELVFRRDMSSSSSSSSANDGASGRIYKSSPNRSPHPAPAPAPAPAPSPSLSKPAQLAAPEKLTPPDL